MSAARRSAIALVAVLGGAACAGGSDASTPSSASSLARPAVDESIDTGPDPSAVAVTTAASTTPAAPPTSATATPPSAPPTSGGPSVPATTAPADDATSYGGPVPSGSVQPGAGDVFVVNAEGALFWHAGLVGDDPAAPVQIALADPDTQIGRVAGVHDGSVVYAQCCAPAEIRAATGGTDAEPATLVQGSSADVGPDGDLVVVAAGTVSIIDLAARTERSGTLDATLEPSDVWWGPNGPTVLVRRTDGPALARIDPDTLQVLGLGEIESEPEAQVTLAGSGPSGEIAVAVVTAAEGELRIYDPETLRRVPSLTRTLPPGVASVRTTQDGAVLWVDGDTLWHKPADDTRPTALGRGSAAAWFAVD